MKKVLFSVALALLVSGVSMAQEKQKQVSVKPAAGTTEQAAATTLKAENLNFKTEVHDFGTVEEGPTADFEFSFTNTGKEPILLQNVHASCGCTTPSYSKDPVLPGKTGIVKASYNTSGRPGPFTKSITVATNAGTKVLTIKGTVEKAPTSSVPENNSMIKTN
ncbi:MAG: hypothetical protein BGO69_15380 [Bacteroidetes bacterium 46-16]|nr:MAG: hypothetical protein BGO69_15380 [Bacteroidetes bacterium 46-16]